MKRIALGGAGAALAILILAVVLAPVFGARARSLLEAELAGVGELLEPNVTVDVAFDDWDVGWFESTASATIEVSWAEDSPLGMIGGGDEGWRATLPDLVTLRHGPIILHEPRGIGWGSVELVVGASLLTELDLRDRIGVDHLARIGVFAGMFGTTEVSLDMPAFEYEVGRGTGTRIGFGGLAVGVSVDRGGAHVSADGELVGFELDPSGGSAVVADDLAWSVESARDERFPELLLGSGRVELGRLLLSAGEPSFELVEARLEASNAIDGGAVVAEVRYEAAAMTVVRVRLDNMVLDVDTSYGADRLLGLMESVPTLDLADDQVRSALFNELLREPLAFNLHRLAFEHDDLPAVASFAFAHRGDELPDTFNADLPPDFVTLAPYVDARLEIAVHRDLPARLGGAAADLLSTLVGVGIVVESVDDYTLRITFDGHDFTVNGQPFGLLDLLGLLDP